VVFLTRTIHRDKTDEGWQRLASAWSRLVMRLIVEFGPGSEAVLRPFLRFRRCKAFNHFTRCLWLLGRRMSYRTAVAVQFTSDLANQFLKEWERKIGTGRKGFKQSICEVRYRAND
jgi:hypothetical protein